MGKSKQSPPPPAPGFSNSSVIQDGRTTSKTYKDKKTGQIITEYFSDPNELAFQNQLSDMLHNYLPNVNTFTPEYYAQKSSALKAQQDLGTQQINDVYNPMLTNLKNDVASRFGTLNSSSFLDELNNIEKQRGYAVSDLSNNLLANSNNMDAQQLAKNYDFINLLQGNQANNLSEIFSNLNLSNALSGMSNSFNLSNYLNQVDYNNALNASRSNSSFLGPMLYNSSPLNTISKQLSFLIPSDKNLKENISPLNNALNIIEQLQGYKYNYDTANHPELPTGKHVGVMAQDVEKVLTQAVAQTNIGKAVNYAEIIPVLIGAIQQLSEQINNLQGIKKAG